MPYNIESDWDLSSCIGENFERNELSFENINQVLANIPGEHEGKSYWWILELKNGETGILTGSCDYTGWD